MLITFEGPEGSGKSTHARRLVAHLRRQRVPVVATREPGGTAAGRSIRRLLLHAHETSILPLTEVYLFMASRAQLVADVIRPALRRGRVVVCDRFLDATLAYQGGGGGVRLPLIRQLARPALDGVWPDVTFLMDISPERGFRRLRARRDRLEAKSRRFHQRVHQSYLRLARREPRRFIRIDATQPMHQVQHTIRTYTMAHLGEIR